MSNLLQSVDAVFEFLERRGVRAALVGGIAVSARTEPRFTRDVDVVVAVQDDQEAEAVVGALRALGYVAVDVVEQEATGRLSTARCVRSGDTGGAVVDLLFASSGIEAEVVEAAEPLDVGAGVVVPVATATHLAALKILARGVDRPQDDLDLRYLIPDADLPLLRELLATIERRGYHRQKALAQELDDTLSRLSSG